MHNDSRSVLIKVCREVFEQLAFMFGEAVGKDDVTCASDRFIRASMSFKGGRAGALEIVLPLELSEALASNVLGLDDDAGLDPGTPEDVVKELLNTVCGRLLTALYGNEAVFDLSVPETSLLDNQQWREALAARSYSALDIENSPVLILASES